jgi:hypothetical protein
MKLTCKRCDKEWDYTGAKVPTISFPQYTSCPRCHTSVMIKLEKVDE